MGMLWFDGCATKRVEDKVEDASAHYRRKYGRPVAVAYVHPKDFAKIAGAVSVQVRSDVYVMVNYVRVEEV